MFENLLFEDEYEEDYTSDVYESTFFDADSMYMDAAMESFSYIDPVYDDGMDFIYASESFLEAIETDLCAIDMELEVATEGIKDVGSKAINGIKRGIAKVLSGMASFCHKRMTYWASKQKKDKATTWQKREDWCKRTADKLRGVKDASQANALKAETDKKEAEIKQAAEAEKSEISKYDKTVSGSTLGNNGRMPNPDNTFLGDPNEAKRNGNGFDPKLSQALDKAAANSAGSAPKIRKINNTENDIANLPKNVVATPKYGYKQTAALNKVDEDIEKEKKKPKTSSVARNLQKLFKKKGEILKGEFSSFIDYDPDFDYAAEGYVITYEVCDYENGYAVAVEGLFSKPKTAEKLLERVQKKVGRLKTIGQCDDMLRQLDAESRSFNAAISGLKRATAEFQKSNDKATLRKTAGPILKELNKKCRILKIKNFASDPKNITQDEIKKLRDFISGAKQLINARKKVLKGGVTESMSYFNEYEDMDFAYESFVLTDPSIDEGEWLIAEEAMMNSIESDLYALDNEYNDYDEFALESSGGFKQKIGNAIATIFEKLAGICEKRRDWWKSKEKTSAKSLKKAAVWDKRAQVMHLRAAKFKGEITKKDFEEGKRAAKECEKKIKEQINAETQNYRHGTKANMTHQSDHGVPLQRNDVYTPASPAHAGPGMASYASGGLESLIEDFDDADQAIAIATEGIIDPDAKRAHRIKFGEKKRQITAVVKKARAAKKAKDFSAAIALYQEPKKGYQGLMAEAKKIPDRATGAYNKAYAKGPTYAKTSLINWCIKKMGECDNAIEAIRNGQMRTDRKAAAKEARAAKKAAKESYLDDVELYESVIESLGYEDDDDFDDYDDLDRDYGYDDDDDGIGGLESLMM